MKKCKAFTLIEVLLVTAIMALIGIAIVLNLGNAIRVWKTVYGSGVMQEDAVIFLDRFQTDVRNALLITNVPFVGNQHEVAISTLVSSQTFKSRTIGRVKYVFDSANKRLYRYQQDFAGIYNDRFDLHALTIEHVKSVKFSFYHFEKTLNACTWGEEWTSQKTPPELPQLPLAVRLEIEYDDGSQQMQITKTVQCKTASINP